MEGASQRQTLILKVQLYQSSFYIKITEVNFLLIAPIKEVSFVFICKRWVLIAKQL